MRRLRTSWLWFGVLLVLFLPRLVLPPLLVTQLEQAGRMETGGVFQVELVSRWGWDLFFGRVSRLKIHGEDWQVEGLRIRNLDLELQGLTLDLGRLINAHELSVEAVEDLEAAVTVFGEDINEYFWENIDPSRTFAVELAEGRAALVGRISAFGREMQLSLAGTFVIRDDTLVVFVPEDFVVEQARLPASLIQLISDRYELVIDFSQIPLPLKLDDVMISDGQINLYGSEAR